MACDIPLIGCEEDYVNLDLTSDCIEQEKSAFCDNDLGCDSDISASRNKRSLCDIPQCDYLCSFIDSFKYKLKPRATAMLTALLLNTHSTIKQLCQPLDACIVGNIVGIPCYQCKGLVSGMYTQCGKDKGIPDLCLESSDLCLDHYAVRPYQFKSDDEIYLRVLKCHLKFRNIVKTHKIVERMINCLFDAPLIYNCDGTISIGRKLTEKESKHILFIMSILPNHIKIK